MIFQILNNANEREFDLKSNDTKIIEISLVLAADLPPKILNYFGSRARTRGARELILSSIVLFWSIFTVVIIMNVTKVGAIWPLNI